MSCTANATLTALIALFAASACQHGTDPVRIESGLVAGTYSNGVASFKGVPYAAPPTGDLRWREPRAKQSWQGVLEAREFKPACMQIGPTLAGWPQEHVSEDCLYLNIWSASRSRDQRRPVMVWFHGGAFVNGSPSTGVYWGESLAGKGVVVVNVAYRLGAFGFLAHPMLTQESGRGASGNYGIMDMIAALRWVQKNIAQFGGDPQQVTIFGHSAGAFAVCRLMVAPAARGLFQRAIAQSGCDMAPAGSPEGAMFLREAEGRGARVVEAVGARTLDELRHASAEKLSAAWIADGAWHRASAIVDGYVIPQDMTEAFESGKQAKVALLLGYTENEGGNMPVPTVSAKQYVDDVKKQYGALADRVLAIYPARTDEEAARSQARLFRDNSFAWHMWTLARLHSRSGSKVFFYRFAHALPFPPDSPLVKWGAAHGTELLYVFDNLGLTPLAWTDADRELAQQMSGYWTNFAKSGDPDDATLPRWPAFAENQSTVMVLKTHPAVDGLLEYEGLKLQDEHMRVLRDEVLLALPWKRFDQTLGSGWRVYAIRKEHLGAARLIETYLARRRSDLTPVQRAVSHFHAGAELARVNLIKEALLHFDQADVPPGSKGAPEDWNELVIANKAFLRGDRAAILASKRRVEAMQSPAFRETPAQLLEYLGQPWGTWDDQPKP